MIINYVNTQLKMKRSVTYYDTSYMLILNHFVIIIIVFLPLLTLQGLEGAMRLLSK